MADLRRLDEDLRCIGQALEAKGVTGFELYPVVSGYYIKDLQEHTPSLRSTLGNWLHRRRAIDTQFPAYGFDLAELNELSKSGQARRSRLGQLPQFRDLSNVLRTIGAYLESKEAHLIELHKRPISITLVYRDKSRHEYREDRPVSSFQDFFSKLCENRSRTR